MTKFDQFSTRLRLVTMLFPFLSPNYLFWTILELNYHLPVMLCKIPSPLYLFFFKIKTKSYNMEHGTLNCQLPACVGPMKIQHQNNLLTINVHILRLTPLLRFDYEWAPIFGKINRLFKKKIQIWPISVHLRHFQNESVYGVKWAEI